jgi:hypothetical protein
MRSIGQNVEKERVQSQSHLGCVFLKGRAYYSSKEKKVRGILFNSSFHSSSVSGLLIRVHVPDNIVGQAEDLVARAPGHLGETLGLGLVFEGV